MLSLGSKGWTLIKVKEQFYKETTLFYLNWCYDEACYSGTVLYVLFKYYDKHLSSEINAYLMQIKKVFSQSETI